MKKLFSAFILAVVAMLYGIALLELWIARGMKKLGFIRYSKTKKI